MRITQNMILRNTLQRVNDNRDSMNELHQNIATQKRVQKASDDPISFSRASRFRRNLEINKQYLKNTEDAIAWRNTTSIASDQLYEYALQAYDLASQGADGTADAELRMQLAGSVRGLLQDAVSIGNTQYLGKSIFSGTMTNLSEPFVLTGDVVTYTGNDESIQRRTSENQMVDINTTGQEIVDTELFDALTGLITALEANDVTEINNRMSQMATVRKNVLTLTTSVGSQVNNLTLIKTRLEDTNIDLQAYISEEEDTVMEDAIVRLKSEEIAYQAALQSTSEIMQINILNYLN